MIFKEFFIYLTKKYKKERLEELNAEELSKNVGSDAGSIGEKADEVNQSVGIINWQPNNNIIAFRTKSLTRSGQEHKVMVLFEFMEEMKKQVKDGQIDISNPNTLRAALQNVVRGDLRLHCGCESFKFWGRAYQLTQFDAAIIPEPRPPKVNDPDLKRAHLCHHLLATLKYIMKFEQHIITYIITNDSLFSISDQIKTPKDKERRVDKMVASQLKQLIDDWSEDIGRALVSPELANELAAGIKRILKRRKIRVEHICLQIIKEAIDEKKLRNNVEDFVQYITDNFVPREDREEVKNELFEFISMKIDTEIQMANEQEIEQEQEEEKRDQPESLRDRINNL